MATNPYVTDINLILAFMASMLGFPAGMAVAYLAREELEDGRKHFVIMLHFLFTLAALIFLFSMKLHYLITFALTMLALLLSVAAYTLISNRYIRYIKFSAYYLMFGVIYFLSAGNIIILIIMLSLIFLFGLPAGSIFADEQFFSKQSFRTKPAKKVKKV